MLVKDFRRTLISLSLEGVSVFFCIPIRHCVRQHARYRSQLLWSVWFWLSSVCLATGIPRFTEVFRLCSSVWCQPYLNRRKTLLLRRHICESSLCEPDLARYFANNKLCDNTSLYQERKKPIRIHVRKFRGEGSKITHSIKTSVSSSSLFEEAPSRKWGKLVRAVRLYRRKEMPVKGMRAEESDDSMFAFQTCVQ